MKDQEQGIIGGIDPDYIDRLTARQREIDRGAAARPGIAAALALGSVPVALAALSRDVYAQSTLPTAVKGVLDFALALEIFENEFYKAILSSATFAAARAAAPAAAIATLQQIQKHEEAHVATLLASGATNVFNLGAGSFDFTGARGAGNGPFTKATQNLGFLLQLAQGAEDTGVRAYKGQAAVLLTNGAAPAIMEAALRIHSVEARHAARLRRIRRSLNPTLTQLRWSGAVRGGGEVAAGLSDRGDTPDTQSAMSTTFGLIYGNGANLTTAPSESNPIQAGATDVSALTAASFGADAAQEAFDEPLDRGDVVKIVQQFFIPTIA